MSAMKITDHAVLRYLERVKGLDVETARRDIAKTMEVAEGHDTASGVTSNGFRYVIYDGALVTIKPILRGGKRPKRTLQVPTK